ncbi:hypothetical protein MNV49_006918 [Pseudohyphozyma bogoriensis]|nr:hypothetical protein MNV49_006918 [Pseudohyphozyma bogoriensis]
MRQVGVGERNSRLSFADDASAKRKSMTRQSSYYANGRNSMHGSINSSSGVPVPPLPRSGSTSEDLAPFLLAQAPRSPTRRPNAPRKPSHLVNQSIGSLNYADYPALQLVRDPELVFPTGAPNSPTPGTSDPDGPFADPPTPPPPAAGHASHMPFFGLRSSILSPDELLNRYTRERAGAVSPTAPAPRTQGRTGGWARLLPRSWSSKKNVHEDARTENAVEREKSPFDDAAEKASSTPDSPASSMKNSPSEPEEEASWGQAL